MENKSQSRLFYGILIGIVLISILGIYFVIADLPISEGDEIIKENVINSNLNQVSIPVSSGYYTGEFTYELTGNESKWVEDVKIINREVVIIPKEKVEDRTYTECEKYDTSKGEAESKCLEEKNVIYNIPNTVPVKDKESTLNTLSKSLDSKTGKDVFVYSIPLDVIILR